MDRESNNTILIIDDDKNIIAIISMYLRKEGFGVSTCERGDLAMDAFIEANPALVLLDVMLPGSDGWSVLNALRKVSDVPVIMLTAKGDTGDRVQGLELGADDYITKPFDAKELIARIKAVLRRYSSGDAEEKRSATIEGLSVSIDNYSVFIDGKQIDMTPKEIELLFFFVSNCGKVFTRDQLLEQVWGFEFYGDTRTVDVHIKRIREKIGKYAARLKTVWSVGYRFDAEE